MIEYNADHCAYLLFEQLDAAPMVAHGVFTRQGGFSGPPFNGLNCSVSVGDTPAAVQRNYEAIVNAVGLPLVSARIDHGAEVTVIERARPDEPLGALRARLRATTADAMVTRERGLGLFWAFGDCAPILLYDPRHQVVALAHGGWRGAAGAIGPHTLRVMRERFETRADEVIAGIGPAIESCCYEVKEEARAQFAAAEPVARETVVFAERPGEDGATHLFLDMTHSNERQLLAAGIRADHLEVAGYCTGCTGAHLFYSHRKEPAVDGRFGVVIGLR